MSTPYKEVRAKHKARDAMKQAHKPVRIDTHRPIQLEQSCAEEGGGWSPLDPIETVEAEFPWLWMLYGIAILATVAACSLIAGAA